MVSRTSFDSPGLLYWMSQVKEKHMGSIYNPTTRLNQYMASGTSRGNKIINIVDAKSMNQTVSKTQTVV